MLWVVMTLGDKQINMSQHLSNHKNGCEVYDEINKKQIQQVPTDIL
jgi:hypothetical protein